MLDAYCTYIQHISDNRKGCMHLPSLISKLYQSVMTKISSELNIEQGLLNSRVSIQLSKGSKIYKCSPLKLRIKHIFIGNL